jgi:ATP phosphoribosyltransferase regulatory subunit
MRKWLLPEYIEDILPAPARRIEALRRGMLDLFEAHGYQLVVPPLLEYVESLLTGTGHDLDLRTFKLVDQLSGRTMGLRADITPQVARIDAHLMNRRGVNRLCYAGSVLHTLPAGINRSREPLQIGAEIYGHAGVESDIEIQRLLRAVLTAAQGGAVRLDIGHVGVFRALVADAGLDAELQAELLAVLQHKDRPGLAALVAGLDPDTAQALSLLPELYGGPEVLEEAARRLPARPAIREALAVLGRLVADNGMSISIDLADLRGYHYHSGVVFAAYAAGLPGALVVGGRYDKVGEAFGRARPATGFSMDLRELAQASALHLERNAILAPLSEDPALRARVAELRAAGEVVIEDLPGHGETLDELGCSRRLVQRGAQWDIEPLPPQAAGQGSARGERADPSTGR